MVCYIQGFCVARSTLIGNAKASKSGTGNRYRFSRFCFLYDEYYEKQKKCIVGIVAHVFDALGGWSTGSRF